MARSFVSTLLVALATCATMFVVIHSCAAIESYGSFETIQSIESIDNAENSTQSIPPIDTVEQSTASIDIVEDVEDPKTKALAGLTPTKWDYNTGYTYLMFSYAAYCDQALLQTWTCKWCRNNTYISGFKPTAFPYDWRSNTFGFVGYSDSLKQIIVSFRGTESDSIKNWVVDLKLAKMSPYQNYTGVMVHDGFNAAYMRLKDQVISSVTKLLNKYPTYPVIVTGHSLGGALATLAAIDISLLRSSTYLWNYGSPRVGNELFSTLFQNAVKTHFRVVNNRDGVAHVPPQKLKFYHVPTEVWERGTRPQDFKVCNDSGEDPRCSDGLLVTLDIDDHLNYFGVYENCRS